MGSALLLILGEGRDLLWVGTKYRRYTSSDRTPISDTEGRLIALCFVSQENDDVFLPKNDKEKMEHRMGLKWFFRILFLVPIMVYCQGKEFKNKGFSADVSALILFPYDFRIPSEHDEISETSTKSKIVGTSIHFNYYISNHFAFTASSGYEFINQPKIEYIPITGGIKWILNDTKESLLTSFDLGGQLGSVEQFGVLMRIGVGYRFVIFKRILGDFELCYSHQNLYKTFTNSDHLKKDYHNIESAGFKIGIEIY
ncbi:hypothetical protein [Flavobacterium sp. N2038]|uniref:hypothetical protein n=1 Tax=Flavobacterium sp. N2038 TaxID=2986829 RepID=UPI0022253C3B|nr:hypothetical protein [Flavobacterium sp. N2038]